MRIPVAAGLTLLLAAACAVPPAAARLDAGEKAVTTLDARDVDRFARLALECIHREYPGKIAHVLESDADVRPPRELTPVFFGCYDWHSSVHGHWLLARLCRLFPRGAFVEEARAALAGSFTVEKIAAEAAYLGRKARRTFERPYGLAWLLQLGAELHEWDDDDARQWARRLQRLLDVASARFREWLPALEHPARTGEHSQTAFALGLVLDAARITGDRALARLVERRARHYYLADRGWSFAFEPGGEDFLSPGLAEADLMRRVLGPPAFAAWLERFAPALGMPAGAGGGAEGGKRPGPLLAPAVAADRSDGKLAHLDGLNLSRAWMLEGIVAGLPPGDPRRPRLERLAIAHRKAGLAAVTGEHYEGGHWLGSFAVYLVTGRGLPVSGDEEE